MVVRSRVSRMVVPSSTIGRIVAPALREALVAGNRGVRRPRGPRRPSGRRGGGRASGRVVRLVIRGGSGGARSRRRPKNRLPVPRGTRCRVGCQVVVSQRVRARVRLVMV